MIQLLLDNPLLLLFLVAAIGYPLGGIKIAGSRLGVSAVLFVGLAFGALDPEMKLPEIIYMLGMGLFIYTIGLSGGLTFTSSFKRQGLRYNLLVLGVISTSAGLTALAAKLLHIKPSITAGMFAGSLTNTPGLAGALDTIKHHFAGEHLEQLLAEPVLGYSITYPVGIIGMVLAINVAQRLWRIDYAAEAKQLHSFGAATEPLKNFTIRVTRPGCCTRNLEDLRREEGWLVMFGRLKRGDQVIMAFPEEKPKVGDLLTVVGTAGEIRRVADYFGEKSEEELDLDRSEFDFRRIFVSNPQVAGRRLKDLNLRKKFGAVITRVRRGDDDFLPNGDLVLELGDRVRVLAYREHMQGVTKYLGDSYRAVSEIDILTFSLGLALGLLLGSIPIPLPGGITFKLGFAGGPLVMALFLGTLGRTGKMVWNLPYSANLTLRQIGLVLFLAGIGTRAGYSFVSTMVQGGGLVVFATGAVITCFTAFLALWVGYRLLNIPMNIMVGILAGLQTQTAVVGYALEQTKNDYPNIGFASVYPIATITKILYVQMLLLLLE
ncbi:aspartate:alanine exchanger family transporter [Geobacter sp. DSM 9736]|uniref:aspartate:alanine exchanger family transporter n=1 Tax=Geobacter sp. DSM 9736 TaxID=1277350 RepID=UPI000B5114FA|nr:aspartate:alanine exchanger family transporter [Geobacter sp. DSM 9736]SNB48019.1 putative transport protein [Geobacter sp. DSM 9736]